MKSFLDELWYRGYHALIWSLIIALYLSTGVTENINHMYIWFTSVLIMIGLIAIMYAKSTVSNKHAFEVESYNKGKSNIVQCFILVVIAFALMVIVEQVYTLIKGNAGLANDKLIEAHIGALIPFFIASCIVAPIIEEIIFRGYSYMLINSATSAICKKFKIQHYEKGIKVSTYIIVTSLVFGLIHKQDSILSLLTYVFSGVMFASLFLITKRIWVNILAHAINNSYAALKMVYIKGNEGGNEWLIIGCLSILVILCAVIYKAYPMMKDYFLNYDKRYSKSYK